MNFRMQQEFFVIMTEELNNQMTDYSVKFYENHIKVEVALEDLHHVKRWLELIEVDVETELAEDIHGWLIQIETMNLPMYTVNLDCTYFDDDFKAALEEMYIEWEIQSEGAEYCNYNYDVKFTGTEKQLKNLITTFWCDDDLYNYIKKVQ